VNHTGLILTAVAANEGTFTEGHQLDRKTEPVGNGQLEAIRAAGPSIKIEVTPVDVRDASELERAVGEFAH